MSLRVLRSSVSKEDQELAIKRRKLELEEIANRPFIKYTGNIVYHTTLIDCAFVCDNLIKSANDSIEEHFVVGFDLEWPFSFQTGPGKIATIQISPNLGICYILHISALKNLPRALSEFLQHPKVRLTGVNIKNDVRKLSRDFPGFDVNKLLENCIDTGVLANQVLPVTQRWSMEKLVDYVASLLLYYNLKAKEKENHIEDASLFFQSKSKQ